MAERCEQMLGDHPSSSYGISAEESCIWGVEPTQEKGKNAAERQARGKSLLRLEMERQDVECALLVFSLTLVQYFLSMIQFIPFGMVMHILGTVCWKYGIHILILQGAALRTLSGVSEETLDFKQS